MPSTPDHHQQKRPMPELDRSNRSAPKVERCPDIWYQDGTIIVQAESLQFRVYGGILAENSPVFSDMFNVAQPQAGDFTDGCPVVHLQDSKTDLYHFLKSLHSAGYHEKWKTTFTVASALLRLGIKYDVDYFKQSTFRTIASLFPTTLDEWDHRDATQIQCFYGLPFSVIKLCRETGLVTPLPAAMCSACFTPDGVIDILDGCTSSKHGHHVELDHTDKIICLKARENLHIALRQLLLDTLLRRALSCTSPERCGSARLESLHGLIGSKMMRDPPQHIFHVKFQTLLRFNAGICSACLSTCEANFDLARANLWLELPSFFGLPSWEELRKSLQTHGLQYSVAIPREKVRSRYDSWPRGLSAIMSLV